jgi:predicted phosphodiesterase
MTIKIAVVSDLHCHHPNNGLAETLLLSTAARKPILQHPVSALRELINKEGLSVDALLMPGDITNRVDSQGMNTGWAFICEIAECLKTKNVIPTLGNHDVASRDTKTDPFALAKGLLPDFPMAGQAGIEFWANGFCFVEFDHLRVLVINSAATHTNATAAEHGYVSDQQLESIEKFLGTAQRKRFNIAICHHHPLLHEDIGLGTSDVMENGSKLTSLLAKYRFDLIVHGHKHHPRLTYVEAPQLAVFAAGSFAAAIHGGLATRTRNLFHTIELHEAAGPPEHRRGIIRTWQFQFAKGWTPASIHAADFPHMTGFGSQLSVEAIAERIATAFGSTQLAVAKWGDVVAAVDDVNYIPPAAFRAVGEILRSRDIHLCPAAPDQPQLMGAIK